MASVRAASVDGQADLANLVINPGFGSISEGAPDGWHTHSPRSVLSPRFEVDRGVFRTGGASAVARGGGNPHCIGNWGQVVPVHGGKSYRVRVVFRHEGIEDVNTNVLIALVWKAGDTPNFRCHTDHVESFSLLPDGWSLAQQVFRAPDGCNALDLELYLRLSAQGAVWWDHVEVRETQPVPPRMVRLAAMRWHPDGEGSLDRNLRELGELVDAAGAQRADLVCLPEMLNAAGIAEGIAHDYAACAEPIPGPTYGMLSERARQWGMYVLGCIYEREGDLIWNTAFLLNRRGELVGKYCKVHLYWPEEREGVTPGDEWPVFDTEIGKIGVMTCYDSWFPESARILALKGADVILFPNGGYGECQVNARPGDNAVYLVNSTLNSDAEIVNCEGEILAQSKVNGVIVAAVDLNDRQTAAGNAGGTMNASPGGRRALRHAPSLGLYEEISTEMRRHLQTTPPGAPGS